VSGTERFEVWRDQMIEVVGPVDLDVDDPLSFRSEMHAVGLGGVQLTSLMVSPCRGRYAIAARWGFSDAAHFTRLFRDRHEVGPREYRDLAGQGTDGPSA
jgi:hypothetical protein